MTLVKRLKKQGMYIYTLLIIARYLCRFKSENRSFFSCRFTFPSWNWWFESSSRGARWCQQQMV